MPVDRKQLEYLRSVRIDGAPDFGQKLYEILNNMVAKSLDNLEQQTNSNVNGQPAAPPAPDAVDATAQGDGRIQIGISHQASEFYRGNNYFIEHASNPEFSDPQVQSLGPARNGSIYVGNQARYVRVYNQYPGSNPSAPVYLGSSSQPRAVHAGGPNAPVRFMPSMGSGTGKPGQGLSGFGNVPYRSRNGQPPTR